MIRHYKDAFARFDGQTLELGNDCFTRSFDLSGGYLRTTGIKNAAGRLLAGPNGLDRDFYFYGDRCPMDEMRYSISAVTAVPVISPFFDSPHLHVLVSIREDRQKLVLRKDFYIYPKLAALVMRTRICSPVYPAALWSHRGAIREHFQSIARENLVFEGCVDSINPVSGFQPVETVIYRGRTDFVDDQVTRSPVQGMLLNGNLLFLRDTNGQSLFYLQEAPPSEERRDVEEYDFRFENGQVFSCSWNLSPEEIADRHEFRSPRHVLFMTATDEEERTLKEYQRLRSPAPDIPVTVNPWGSGSFYKYNSPEFLLREVAASKECGAELYQVDDSWQGGGVLGDLTGRNSYIDPARFWQVDRRFWDGDLTPLAESAEKSGVGLSLWFAPGYNVRYRDWRTMRDILLDFHRRYGICFFKLDAMHIPSAESERNLELLMRSVRRASHGKVAFQIDLTGWGQRQGYFRFLEYGAIFLENRYTTLNSGLGYHPERTWRNVWRLAEYNRLQKFQIEIPSPNGINYDFYRNKGETAPDVYPWEYWIALALFAKPLLWLAPSLLSIEQRQKIASFVSWHKAHAALLDTAVIRHFGQEPDGSSLSGLYVEGNHPMVIAFREQRCSTPETFLAMLPEKRWKIVLGQGALAAEKGGFRLTVPECPGFALFEALEK